MLSRRTIFGVLVALLGVGMITSVAAFAHGPGGGAQMMRRFVSARIDDALAAANVTADQRTAIYASRDRAFATDLVYGTVRRRRALDFLLAPCSSQPLARLEPVVRAGLRMGAYQLVDGVPAHAAVGETVSAVAGIAPMKQNSPWHGTVRRSPVSLFSSATCSRWPVPASPLTSVCVSTSIRSSASMRAMRYCDIVASSPPRRTTSDAAPASCAM